MIKISKKETKNKLSKINFGSLLTDTCQPEIVVFKFISLCAASKTYVATISHIYNLLVSKKVNIKGFEQYILDCRSDFDKYKNFYNEHKGRIIWERPLYDDVLEPLFKEFCISGMVNKIMHCYKTLIAKYNASENWIVTSSSSVRPFLNCSLDLHTIHRIDSSFALDKANKLYEASVKFYEQYITPNFDLARAIDLIGNMLEELQRTQNIKCDRIYPYIKALYDKNLINIDELNMNYLETNDKSIFITTLMDNLMKNNTDKLKPDIHTMSQLKNMLNHLHKKLNNTGMSQSVGIAKDLLNSIS